MPSPKQKYIEWFKLLDWGFFSLSLHLMKMPLEGEVRSLRISSLPVITIINNRKASSSLSSSLNSILVSLHHLCCMFIPRHHSPSSSSSQLLFLLYPSVHTLEKCSLLLFPRTISSLIFLFFPSHFKLYSLLSYEGFFFSSYYILFHSLYLSIRREERGAKGMKRMKNEK